MPLAVVLLCSAQPTQPYMVVLSGPDAGEYFTGNVGAQEVGGVG